MISNCKSLNREKIIECDLNIYINIYNKKVRKEAKESWPEKTASEDKSLYSLFFTK